MKWIIIHYDIDDYRVVPENKILRYLQMVFGNKYSYVSESEATIKLNYKNLK